MKFIHTPIPYRFKDEADAMKFMYAISNRQPPPLELCVPHHEIIGNNICVTEAYKNAPYELGYVALEQGEVLPDYVDQIPT